MKRRVIIDVDSSELFDCLHAMKGDTSGVGERLAGVLLTGDVSFPTAVGLGFYGIAIAATQVIGEAPAGDGGEGEGGAGHG